MNTKKQSLYDINQEQMNLIAEIEAKVDENINEYPRKSAD